MATETRDHAARCADLREYGRGFCDGARFAPLLHPSRPHYCDGWRAGATAYRAAIDAKRAALGLPTGEDLRRIQESSRGATPDE